MGKGDAGQVGVSTGSRGRTPVRHGAHSRALVEVFSNATKSDFVFDMSIIDGLRQRRVSAALGVGSTGEKVT